LDEVGHVDKSPNPEPQDRWDEQVSRAFIDYGRYVVPERERQVQTIVALLPRLDGPCTVVELCCGEGLLAAAILERFPTYTVQGFDGSTEMLQRARERLARFGERFQARPFDLAARAWRDVDDPVHAVVTSLALHHLDGDQKQLLFRDVYGMLAPGGAFIIADVMEPAHPLGWELAADAWDEAVRERALELDGTTEGFDFFERERWNMYRYFDSEDIDKPSRLFDQQKWLEQAGFVDVDAYWMRAGHAIFGGWKPAKEGRP
jgi:tRNA (cmo5U34)-methyltransferase